MTVSYTLWDQRTLPTGIGGFGGDEPIVPNRLGLCKSFVSTHDTFRQQAKGRPIYYIICCPLVVPVTASSLMDSTLCAMNFLSEFTSLPWSPGSGTGTASMSRGRSLRQRYYYTHWILLIDNPVACCIQMPSEYLQRNIVVTHACCKAYSNSVIPTVSLLVLTHLSSCKHNNSLNRSRIKKKAYLI